MSRKSGISWPVRQRVTKNGKTSIPAAHRPRARVHLGNAPAGSARSCCVRGRVSVLECGSPLRPAIAQRRRLPLCVLREKDRPHAPRAKATAAEACRTPKASPRRGASAGAVCECAPSATGVWTFDDPFCAPTVRWDTSPGQARDAGAALGQAPHRGAPYRGARNARRP